MIITHLNKYGDPIHFVFNEDNTVTVRFGNIAVTGNPDGNSHNYYSLHPDGYNEIKLNGMIRIGGRVFVINKITGRCNEYTLHGYEK